jgi:hypothetical protein
MFCLGEVKAREGVVVMMNGFFRRCRAIWAGACSAIRYLAVIGPEPWIWTASLVWLAWTDPASMHFTFCPLANIGIGWCPGCGLGHAVSYALHGEFIQSLHEHVLGIPAVVVLTFRITTLIREAHLRCRTTDHSPTHQDLANG